MLKPDVAVVGGGVAGTLAALMLGRAGFDVVLIDPARPQGSEFRCEKLEDSHQRALRRAGVLDELLAFTVRYDGIWIGRRGRLAEHRRAVEFGIDYAALVNRLHGLLPPSVRVLDDKVTHVEPVGDGCPRRLHLASDRHIDARLVVLATGSHAETLATFGYARHMTSRCHSVSIGFDLAPSNARIRDLGALTWFGETPQDRVAYLTVFPLPGRLRANLFVYRGMDDAWLRQLRADPSAVINDALPGFAKTIGRLEVTGPVRFRPVDLVDTDAAPRPGEVLVGDAFSTACPASGTGASKAMIDVERLCNVYAPEWLSSGAVPADAIARFYGDREKRSSDRHSRKVSLFAKRIALDEGGLWTTLRWARAAASRSRHFIPRVHRQVVRAASLDSSPTTSVYPASQGGIAQVVRAKVS